MPAQIIPTLIDGQTRYALTADGVTVQVFEFMGAAALYAILEGYEVTL